MSERDTRTYVFRSFSDSSPEVSRTKSKIRETIPVTERVNNRIMKPNSRILITFPFLLYKYIYLNNKTCNDNAG